jgi:hypothetical protein
MLFILHNRSDEWLSNTHRISSLTFLLPQLKEPALAINVLNAEPLVNMS